MSLKSKTVRREGATPINPYVYAGNDPVNRTDRFGLSADAERYFTGDVDANGIPIVVCDELTVQVEGRGGGGSGGFPTPPRGFPISGFGPGGGGGFGAGAATPPTRRPITPLSVSGPQEAPGCRGATFRAVASVLSDAVTIGTGLVVAKIGLGALGSGLARIALYNPGARHLAKAAGERALIATMNVHTVVAINLGFPVLVEDQAAAFAIAMNAEAAGSPISFTDFVPVLGSVRAINAAVRCAGS